MKVKVNENCIGCGSCVAITESKVFDFNDEGMAECVVDKIDDSQLETVEEAIQYCPTQAIEKID